jgi:HPt (histidine-containing phosphotransfer) domain-containing protein
MAAVDTSSSIEEKLKEWTKDANVMNKEDAIERCCDDPGFLAELLVEMQEDLTSRESALSAALAEGDMHAYNRTCHAVKGAAANLSLQQLSGVAAYGETASKEVEDAKGDGRAALALHFSVFKVAVVNVNTWITAEAPGLVSPEE